MCLPEPVPNTELLLASRTTYPLPKLNRFHNTTAGEEGAAVPLSEHQRLLHFLPFIGFPCNTLHGIMKKIAPLTLNPFGWKLQTSKFCNDCTPAGRGARERECSLHYNTLWVPFCYSEVGMDKITKDIECLQRGLFSRLRHLILNAYTLRHAKRLQLCGTGHLRRSGRFPHLYTGGVRGGIFFSKQSCRKIWEIQDNILIKWMGL